AKVARKMPSAVLANRYSAVTPRNSPIEPDNGTPSAPLTTTTSEIQVQITTTSALLAIFASGLPGARHGIFSACEIERRPRGASRAGARSYVCFGPVTPVTGARDRLVRTTR